MAAMGILTVKDLLVVGPLGDDGDGGRNLARSRHNGRADGVGENAAGNSANGSGKHDCGCVDCDVLFCFVLSCLVVSVGYR